MPVATFTSEESSPYGSAWFLTRTTIPTGLNIYEGHPPVRCV